MIDQFSLRWKEACDLIDYTYPEDLDIWKGINDGVIDISSPVLDRLSPGDVVCMNSINYAYFFLFDMLRPAILDYTPFAMLSSCKLTYIFQNRMLFCSLCDEYKSDEAVIERLSSRSILSKRIRAKRFCELEDELEILAEKGYRTIILAHVPNLPYLDVESIGKGYADHYDALKKAAMRYGLSLIAITSTYLLPKNIDGITTLKVIPERNRLLLAPPEILTVTVDEEKKYRFRIDDDNGAMAGFRIGGRNVLLIRKDERV